MISVQESALPAPRSCRSRSGIAGTARRGRGFHGAPPPICGTFARQQGAGARLRPETDRAAPAHRDIRRRSSVIDHAEARLVNAEHPAVIELDDVPAAVRRRDVVFDRSANGGPTRDLGRFGSNAHRGRAVKLNSGSDFKGLHLSLHHRAGLPLRCSYHRPNGPTMSTAIFGGIS